MTMLVFLPSRDITFVMVAVFNAPVLASALGGFALFFLYEAGEEDASMALGRVWIFFFEPITLHLYSRTSKWKPCGDWRNGFHYSFTGVDTTVFAFATQVKKGDPSKALSAPSSRLEVFSLVPMR